MNELIDAAIFGVLIAVNFALTVGILIVGLSMIFKAIDFSLIAIFGEWRSFSEDEIHEQNLYEINRKVYRFTDEEERDYRESLKRNRY